MLSRLSFRSSLAILLKLSDANSNWQACPLDLEEVHQNSNYIVYYRMHSTVYRLSNGSFNIAGSEGSVNQAGL